MPRSAAVPRMTTTRLNAPRMTTTPHRGRRARRDRSPMVYDQEEIENAVAQALTTDGGTSQSHRTPARTGGNRRNASRVGDDEIQVISKSEFYRASSYPWIEDPTKGPKWLQTRRKEVLEACRAGTHTTEKLFRMIKDETTKLTKKDRLMLCSTPEDDNAPGAQIPPEDDNAVLICCICLEDLTIGTVTVGPCGHMVCRGCIMTWLNQGNMTCPGCRWEYTGEWQLLHPSWLWPGPRELKYQHDERDWRETKEKKLAAIQVLDTKLQKVKEELEDIRSGKLQRKNPQTAEADRLNEINAKLKKISGIQEYIATHDREFEALGNTI